MSVAHSTGDLAVTDPGQPDTEGVYEPSVASTRSARQCRVHQRLAATQPRHASLCSPLYCLTINKTPPINPPIAGD